MQQQQQPEQLIRMQRIATGLLALMAVVFVVSRLLQRDHAYLSYLTAFAEAAMVGALADWFAVIALFRSPFGLPIPHTAVIPKNKDRIAQSFANFLEHNFMTEEIITEELRSVDFGSALAKWLVCPENSHPVARQLVNALPGLLQMLERDQDVLRFLRERMSAILENVKFAPLLGEVIGVLIANRHHRPLFDHFIRIAAEALEQNEPSIRQKIYANSPRWMPKAVDDRYFDSMVLGLHELLDDLAQEDSEWRDRFQMAMEDLIENLKNAPDYEERIAGAARDILQHPIFTGYLASVWDDLRQRLLTDVASDDSQLVAKLEGGLRTLADGMLQDEALRMRLNGWLAGMATQAIVARRSVIADLVSRVIRKWDADTMARKLELQVGKDLQYIRINGTLVGGLVGLLLHLLDRAF